MVSSSGRAATRRRKLYKPREPAIQWIIDQAKRCLDAGASIIMIESEGFTENVTSWRTDVVARIINAVGLEKTMFGLPIRRSSNGT